MPTPALQAAATDPYAEIATPIASSAAPAADSSDPYAAIATTAPVHPGVIDRAVQAAKDWAKPVAELVKPPQTPTEGLVTHAGGPLALPAYRMAQGIVKAAQDVVASTPERYHQAVADFNKTVQDFHNKDYRNALADAVSSEADAYGLGQPGLRQVSDTARDLAQGTKPGGDFVSPAVKAGLTAGSMAAADAVLGPEEAEVSNTLKRNPFRTSKIEPQVAAATEKAGLPVGTPGLTTEAAKQQTAQSALEAKAATQANADRALQNIATQHAATNSLPAPAAGTATRDLISGNGEALVDAGKADYKVLDKYTGGKFTNAQNELKNAQNELKMKAGTTDTNTADLEANVTRAQWNVEKLFDDAVKDGMPRDLADAAKAKFKAGQATLDAGNAVRMANRTVGAAGARETNLNALENRWTALYDSGRLQQAFGEQGAKDALTSIKAARETGEIYGSLPPTESAALRELVANNTKTGKLGASTDWAGVQKDFSNMADRNSRFADVPKVEKFINDQKFYQTLMKVVGRTAASIGVLGAGAEVYNATH